MDVLSKLMAVQDGKSVRQEFIRRLIHEFAKSQVQNGTCVDCLKRLYQKYQIESEEESHE